MTWPVSKGLFQDSCKPPDWFTESFTSGRFTGTPKKKPYATNCCVRLYEVGATGFEPATSWSRTKRSSQAELRPETKSFSSSHFQRYSFVLFFPQS